MIAIVTINKLHFDKYVAENNLDPNKCKQVSVLSDLRDCEFEKAFVLDLKTNVTDYVLNQLSKLVKTTIEYVEEK